jgi:hypothetical protein
MSKFTFEPRIDLKEAAKTEGGDYGAGAILLNSFYN